MANTIKIKQGSVSVEIDAHLKPPAPAGTMSTEQIKALVTARHGVGLVCAATADTIRKVGGDFMVPRGVTAEGLEAAGRRAEDMDRVLADLDTLRFKLAQANAIFDAEAVALLAKVNDQVKAQAKQNKQLDVAFATLRSYFGAGKPKAKKAKTEQ